VADYALSSALMPEEQRRATSERLRHAYPQSPHAAVLATESPASCETLAEIDAAHGSVRAARRARDLPS
jgi:hypothetical protein